MKGVRCDVRNSPAGGGVAEGDGGGPGSKEQLQSDCRKKNSPACAGLLKNFVQP